MSTDRLAATLGKLPPYPGMKDLLEAFGGKEALIDAYVAGQLPRAVEEVVEANFAQLQCWLLARLLRSRFTGAAKS